MTSATGWRQIHELTEIARQAAEVRLAEWLRQEAGLTADLARLDDAARPDLSDDPAMRRAGADLRWQVWCDARRAALLSELARIRYRRAAAEESLRHAARRSIATGAVLQAGQKIEARLRESRAEREGRD